LRLLWYEGNLPRSRRLNRGGFIVPHRHWLVCGLLLAPVAPAAAQEPKPAKIEWKFEKDRTFYQTVTSESSRTLKFPGTDVTRKGRETFFLAWTPTRQEDKNWVLTLKILGFRAEIDQGDKKLAFDTAKDEKAGDGLSAFFQALVGAELSYTLNGEMRATNVEGQGKLVEALIKANRRLESVVNQVLGVDNLKQLAETCFPVPSRDAKKGDIWKRSGALLLGPVGTYEVAYTYTDLGSEKDGNVEQIAVKAELSYKKPSETRTGFPFRITAADLKTAEGTGTIDFRKDRGRVEKSELKLTLKGKVTVDMVVGKETDVEVNQTETTTLTASEDNPVKK
jgi:hypothetical protein